MTSQFLGQIALANTQRKMLEAGIFYEPVTQYAQALPLAEEIIARAKALSVELFISAQPLPLKIVELTAERLVGLLPMEKLPLAAGVTELIGHLGSEVRPGNYFLDALMEEVDKLSSFASFSPHQYGFFQTLAQRGCRLSDLPGTLPEGQKRLIEISQELGISLEYVLGNLERVVRLVKLLKVRERTINLSTLFHNAQSGFVDIDLTGTKKPASAKIMERVSSLSAKGIALEIFKEGEFTRRMDSLTAEDLDKIITETEQNYQVERGVFRRFTDAVLSSEEQVLSSSPPISLKELLACFKFSAADRVAVLAPAVVQQDDPLRWKNTELGRALIGLRANLNWLAVSVGMKAAGDLESHRKDEVLRAQIQEIKQLAGGFSITLLSGRGKKKTEQKISELSMEDMLFDLFCLAVLEKRRLGEVLATAVDLLRFIVRLENHEPLVNLNTLITARLSGEAYVTLLGTQGLVLRNAPLIQALEKLRGLSDKVSLTIHSHEGVDVPLQAISVEDFRRAIILMGRRFRVHHSPERILGAIIDKIVPELLWLPAKVIGPGPHDLNRIVELALMGIPARYPLRRKWTKINLDPLVAMGTCLEPGIRNCMSCPVNNLYGLVMKTSLSLGYEEIITYEATGCFEVYSGIWPYTGKKFPSVHGVFGGAPSEVLGGLAAKRARLRHTLKNGQRPAQSPILHLGWGGDGATFDIGFGNLSGLMSRLQRITDDELSPYLRQRAMYVCYDNEGYQNTGNQYSAASVPGGNTTTNPKGKNRPIGNDIRKKPMVEIMAGHGVPFSARLNIHRQEHITRVVARALEDGDQGSFIHFLQPCTTGWKFVADSLTYELSYLSEEGGLFSPVTIESGVPYLEMYPVPRNPEESFLKLQARFRHLLGSATVAKENLEKVMNYYRQEWQRNLKLTGFDGEIPEADRLGYLEEEHRFPRVT